MTEPKVMDGRVSKRLGPRGGGWKVVERRKISDAVSENPLTHGFYENLK